MPTDRAPSLFFSRLSLRMSPVVPVRTVTAQRVWLQPSVSTFDPPLRQGLERLAQELNAATWRTRTGSLLPFNILASPLAAAARGIDMRSGFRLVPFRSARYGTARYCTARHGTARHAALFARLVTSGRTWSSGVQSNECATRHPISIWGWNGSILAAPRRAAPRALALFIRPSIPHLSNRSGRLRFGKYCIPTDSWKQPRKDLVINSRSLPYR